MLQHIINLISPFLNIEWPKVSTHIVYTPGDNGNDTISIQVNLQDWSEQAIKTWMDTFDQPFYRDFTFEQCMSIRYELPRATVIIVAFVPEGFLR